MFAMETACGTRLVYAVAPRDVNLQNVASITSTIDNAKTKYNVSL